MRDAIVFTGLSWEMFNVPERISIALAGLGCKVLHCEPPMSVLRGKPPAMRVVADGVHSLRLRFISSRFNSLPYAPLMQARMVRKQIQTAACQLGLREPIFFYMQMDNLFPLCRLMKRDHFIVHTCIDEPSELDYERRYVEVSDRTLVIPKSTYHKLRAKFGSKVEMMRQSVDFSGLTGEAGTDVSGPGTLSAIARPRLAYLGPPYRRLNLPVLTSVLRTHPEWQFISVGPVKAVPLPNAHTVPWVHGQGRSSYLRNIDVGFLPYNCHNESERHAVPLKLFDCFALGIPVVTTPLINLWEYKDLVYFGDTADELSCGVEAALKEAPDNPKRAARIDFARRHSLEQLAAELAGCLPLEVVHGDVVSSLERIEKRAGTRPIQQGATCD